jgi:hypothetical protein
MPNHGAFEDALCTPVGQGFRRSGSVGHSGGAAARRNFACGDPGGNLQNSARSK